MFKFNFNTEPNECSDDSTSANDSSISVSARHHDVDSFEVPSEMVDFFAEHKVGGLSVRTLEAERWIDANLTKLPAVLAESEREKSDLICGRYEGGMKVWECCWDLVSYLSQHVQVDGLRVAELGCGAGIPGMWTMMNGARSLLVQDFNSDVIDLLTLSNLKINLQLEEFQRCQAFSGDWASLSSTWRDQGLSGCCDLVLTSETIYNTQNCASLLNAINCLLASDGCCYVAAKSFYFGVGGSIKQFTELVNSRGDFTVTPVFSTENQLRREILLLRRKLS